MNEPFGVSGNPPEAPVIVPKPHKPKAERSSSLSNQMSQREIQNKQHPIIIAVMSHFVEANRIEWLAPKYCNICFLCGCLAR
jgi:hypothetical protein